ncbi:MAG: transposase [Flammeovirgaceae bacterium]|jgi:putative transposase|nr:transposase [Flammeovirgaceae bacterium]
MCKDIFEHKRKSYIKNGELYFWTATINKWQRLLERDEFKNVIVNSLTYLSEAGKMDVFAFVIMPNHIHVIWRINEYNGKETAQGSFLKYTAHEFKKMLKSGLGEAELSDYAVDASNKNYEFWQRDSLAIHLYTPVVAYQKLEYIHLNPLAEHWQLVKDPCAYKYSTARYYEMGIKDFSFIKDLRDEF